MTKARRIADYCRETGHTAEMIRATTDNGRSLICFYADVNEASAETWAVVIGLLGATETMTDAQRTAYETAAHGEGGDPFAGLPS